MSEDGKYGNKKVSRDQVLALYQFAKQTKGTYTFGNGNSYYACDIGVGNCTDYHSYFISLSRILFVSCLILVSSFVYPSSPNLSI